MKCDKCGEPILVGDSFCTNCGKKVEVQPVPQQVVQQPPQQQIIVNQQLPNYQVVAPQQQVISEETKQGNLLCVISLLLYFLGPVLAGILTIILSYISEDTSLIGSGLSIVSRIAAYVVMIFARVKYPTNKFAKVLMWIYIGLLAFSVIMAIMLIIIIIVGIFSIATTFGG